MSKASPARHPPPIAAVLKQTARDILGGACKALRDPALEDTVAIHETRKAMKRWRALLRLLTFALEDEAKRLRDEARDLSHALRRSRDAQSALDALDDVLKDAAPNALPRSAPAAMRQRLQSIRSEAEAGQLGADERARLAARLDAITEGIADWPLEDASCEDLARALGKTYRRGCRSLPEDWQAADAEQLHELRQRTVELRHQLGALAPLMPGLPKPAIAQAQRLRSQLGRRQDLSLLWPLMAPRQPLARWRSRLTPLIEAREADHTAAAQRSAALVFARKPKAFRKAIAELLDHAPKRAGKAEPQQAGTA